MVKRCGIYLRVSTDQQSTENQFRILQEVAQRSGWTVVQVFEDAGISGAKSRDQRPGYDALLKAVHRREIDMVAAFAVDRLGRSLPDLVAFLSDIQARGCDLYLHAQAVDTSTPSGRMLFQMLAVFAEFERSIITTRINAGLERARAKGTRLGRPAIAPIDLKPVRDRLNRGQSIRVIAKATGFSTATVQRVKQTMRAEAAPIAVWGPPI